MQNVIISAGSHFTAIIKVNTNKWIEIDGYRKKFHVYGEGHRGLDEVAKRVNNANIDELSVFDM
jgi:hypothetical protein